MDYCQNVAEHGLTLCCDLRPDGDTHLALRQLKAESGEQAEQRMGEILRRIEDDTAAYVDAAKGHCSIWEWWGEFDCPHTGGMWPGKGATYPPMLEAFGRGVKSVQPDGQVWNGGYGVNFQPQFLEGLIEACPTSFDGANWHHYNIGQYWAMHSGTGEFQFDEPLHKSIMYTADKFRRMFEQSRTAMAAAGCTAPFVSSEWGMPVVDDYVVSTLRAVGLKSYVFQDGVYGLCETEAAQYLDAWLEVFKQTGFVVLNYHRLRDSLPFGPDEDGTFWGAYCGLIYSDGEPKAKMLEVIKHWATQENGGAE